MSKILPTNYSLYETVYNNEFPLEQYYVILYGTIPSKYSDNKIYDVTISEFLLSSGYLCESQITTARRLGSSTTNIYVNRKNHTIVKTSNDNTDEFLKIEISYSMGHALLSEIFDWDKLKTYERKKKKRSISLVKSEMGHLDLEEFDLPVPIIDI